MNIDNARIYLRSNDQDLASISQRESSERWIFRYRLFLPVPTLHQDEVLANDAI